MEIEFIMQKILLFSIFYLSGTVSMLWAEPVITVKSEPPLPLQNLIKDASFEGDCRTWTPSQQFVRNNEIAEDTAFSGKKSYKISGGKEDKPYGLQRIDLPEPIPAGTPLYVGFASKSAGTDSELERPSVSLCLLYTDGNSNYVRTSPIPGEDHDWVWCELISTTAHPVKIISLYLFFHNQQGVAFWDDVIVKAGSVKLSINVQGGKIKKVRVFNSKTGLVFDSGIMTKEPDVFTKLLEVPGFGAYYVEVEEASGSVTGSRYPANEDIPSTVPGSIPVFKRFNAEILNENQHESYTVELPGLDNKEVFLELSARLGGTEAVAGFTQALSVAINNIDLSLSNLVPPKNEFTMADGRSVNYFGSGKFIIYYAPWTYSLTTENPYCPVSKKDKNPFNYKFNITTLVKPGKNKITMSNMNGTVTEKIPMFITNCKVSVVAKTK